MVSLINRFENFVAAADEDDNIVLLDVLWENVVQNIFADVVVQSGTDIVSSLPDIKYHVSNYNYDVLAMVRDAISRIFEEELKTYQVHVKNKFREGSEGSGIVGNRWDDPAFERFMTARAMEEYTRGVVEAFEGHTVEGLVSVVRNVINVSVWGRNTVTVEYLDSVLPLGN